MPWILKDGSAKTLKHSISAFDSTLQNVHAAHHFKKIIVQRIKNGMEARIPSCPYTPDLHPTVKFLSCGNASLYMLHLYSVVSLGLRPSLWSLEQSSSYRDLSLARSRQSYQELQNAALQPSSHTPIFRLGKDKCMVYRGETVNRGKITIKSYSRERKQGWYWYIGENGKLGDGKSGYDFTTFRPSMA